MYVSPFVPGARGVFELIDLLGLYDNRTLLEPLLVIRLSPAR